MSVNNRKGPVDAVMQIADKELSDNHQDIIVSYCDYGTWWNYNDFLNGKWQIPQPQPPVCIDNNQINKVYQYDSDFNNYSKF